ncbi:hypothetical protein [Bradyrhizobium sp. CCBAU 53338]|nr:hypothetical protein [Bradyrhizobium sp. CCBAU 53338]
MLPAIAEVAQMDAVPGCISAEAKLLDARIFILEATMSTTARFPGSPRDI